MEPVGDGWVGYGEELVHEPIDHQRAGQQRSPPGTRSSAARWSPATRHRVPRRRNEDVPRSAKVWLRLAT